MSISMKTSLILMLFLGATSAVRLKRIDIEFSHAFVNNICPNGTECGTDYSPHRAKATLELIKDNVEIKASTTQMTGDGGWPVPLHSGAAPSYWPVDDIRWLTLRVEIFDSMDRRICELLLWDGFWKTACINSATFKTTAPDSNTRCSVMVDIFCDNVDGEKQEISSMTEPWWYEGSTSTTRPYYMKRSLWTGPLVKEPEKSPGITEKALCKVVSIVATVLLVSIVVKLIMISRRKRRPAIYTISSSTGSDNKGYEPLNEAMMV